jgi:hypothetical protein
VINNGMWSPGKAAAENMTIWPNAEDQIRTEGDSNEVKAAALRKLVHEGCSRTEANQACGNYFRRTHDIWGGM